MYIAPPTQQTQKQLVFRDLVGVERLKSNLLAAVVTLLGQL